MVILLVVILMTICAAPLPAEPQETAETLSPEVLSPEAFGEGRQEKAELDLPLTVAGRPAGEIAARLTGAEAPRLHRDSLLEAIEPELSETAYERLAEEWTAPYLPFAAIRESLPGSRFDRSTLTAAIALPAEMLSSGRLFLQEQPFVLRSEEIAAAPFSFYLNYHADADLLYRNYGESSEWSLPLQLGLYPNLQLYRWVLEAGSEFTTEHQPYGTLEYLRLIKDFPAAGLRLAAGTVDAAADGAAAELPIDGITAGTAAALAHVSSPYRPLTREILLEQPAEVTVYLNGRLLKRIALEAGRHELIDIPYVSGLNELKITIRRADGKERTIHTLVPFDAAVQKPQELSYAVSLGTPQHRFADPLFSGFINYGLHRSLTAGLAFQAGTGRYIGSIKALWVSPAGTWGSTFGVSGDRNAGIGMNGNLQYRLSFPSRRQLPSFGLQLDYRDPRFRPSVQSEEPAPYRYRISGTLGQVLPWNSYAHLSSSYSFGDSDRLQGYLTLLKSIGDSGSLALSLGAVHSPPEPWSLQGSISLSIHPREAPHSTSYSQDLTSGESGAAYTYSGGGQMDPVYSARVRGFPPAAADLTGVEGGISQASPHFRTNLEGSITRTGYRTASDTSAVRTGGGIRGALLIAGGRFAFTQPVQDSFLFIVPDETVQGELLSARTNRSGSGLRESRGELISFSTLTSYTPISLELDLPMSSPGKVLREERRTLVPSYRSGLVIRAGIRTSIFAEGRILSSQGAPAALEAGRLASLDRPGEEPAMVFTDENGEIQFHDLRPGSYRLELLAAGETVEFTVPENAESPLALGTLVLPDQAEKREESR
jgi:outer membrane usher protein